MAAEKQDEEQSEEPSWWSDLKMGGPVNLVELEEEGVMGWSSPPGDYFQVRSEDYLTSKVKIPAGDWLLKPLALDWLHSTARIDEVLRHPDNRIMLGLKEARKKGEIAAGTEPFVWAINLQVPSKVHHSLVIYYISTQPFEEASLPDRFLNGDDEFRNSRLKLIANIVRGPWIVKTAVGDHAICILGKQLTCRYHRGDNFMEVDVDIGSSMVASAIVHLAINYITTITVDLAFLIEGKTEEELPEKLLGAVRFAELEPSASVPIGATPSSPTPVDIQVTFDEEDVDEDEDVFEDALDTEEGEDSLSSRIWKQIGQRVPGDWWQRQQGMSFTSPATTAGECRGREFSFGEEQLSNENRIVRDCTEKFGTVTSSSACVQAGEDLLI
ncbi:hypothetical protein R1sor_016630 [Riccia sorocarpa]|uniref:Protein ENHANCED DISEASE RESISTANCE 2 C-terminal domain-containing protein n=1 Tax=Riccia sorocarpa TaxID=122646 RepID=A0ABD3HHK1_9MARC